MSSEWDDIKNELKGAKAPLSEDAWGNMNAMLDSQVAAKRRVIILWTIPLLIITALTGFLYLNQSTSNIEPNTIDQKISNTNTIAPTDSRNENVSKSNKIGTILVV